MVLTHTTTHTYAHPFPTVTLAYFIRYTSPKLNPFATHVLSTDTLDSWVDSATGRVHTTRIHLKKSRIPGAVFKLLPSYMTGGSTGNSGLGGGAGDRASYILETSVVDIKEGWMQTESRNLNWTGVLSVIERQSYRTTTPAPTPTSPSVISPCSTDVATTVIFRSRLGERLRGRVATAASAAMSSASSSSSAGSDRHAEGWLSGWMGTWGTKGIQRTIESLASKKTKDGLVKSREGMRVVLEQLRTSGGAIRVMEKLRERSVVYT